MYSQTIALKKYHIQKVNSRKRNIAFELTFIEWYNWWLQQGHDKKDSTPKPNICMCRYNDTGAYNLNNIYCATRAQNLTDAESNKAFEHKYVAILTPLGTFYSASAGARAHGISKELMGWRLNNWPDYIRI